MAVYNPTTSPWQVEARDFPVQAPTEDRAKYLLSYAILAPSTHNTQPWTFEISGDSIHVYADPARWLKVADENKRELYLSVGCAVENLLIAAERFGLGHRVRRFPDPGDEELVAIIEITDQGERSEHRPPALFDAITERHTNREVYRDEPVAPQHRKAMADVTIDDHVYLRFLDRLDTLEKLENLMVRADMHQFADPQWRRELGKWLGSGAFGTSWLFSKLSRLAVTHFDLGESTGKKTARAVRSTPLFGVITTPSDDRTGRVFAGQAGERLWLQANALGLAVHPMNQILQVAEIRDEFADTVDLDERTPQMVVRIGHADPVRQQSPRRPLAEVLV